MTDRRRSLPSVAALLEREDVRALLAAHPRTMVVEAIRRSIDEARQSGAEPGPERDWGASIALNVRSAAVPSLRPLFNATGVVLHTNFGRAPLADVALVAVQEAASGFTNLEYDLEHGRRGSRYVHCVDLLRELTGAEDAMVVNNCASALILALGALARGREVIVSRGELVEIGGSFRVPDIMERSGATLVEIGTTNRTHPDDYRRAIGPRTAVIAKIHRSNFALSGFVSEVDVKSLAAIAGEHGIPIVHDLGSGLLIDLDEYGLSGEPTARAAIAAGATLVLMSGDKLLGGPQAGIIVGASHAISRLRQDAFARAMRVDKMTIAALSATLALYRDPQRALREIPALAMLTAKPSAIRDRSVRVAGLLVEAGVAAEVVESVASVGAGAFPIHGIPSFAVALRGEVDRIENLLRAADRPVIGRISEGRVLLDLRSVPARDDGEFTEAVIAALG